MDSFEFNKIFAAVLVAGLVAMLSGFIAEKLVHPEIPESRAYAVVIPEGDAGAMIAAAPKGAEPIEPLLASADVAAGQKLSRACAACHSFEKGGANKVGPNLWNIVGGPHAHIDGFAYSKALVELKDKPWDYAALNEFLYNPKAAIAGTKMVFAGLKKPEDRANIVAWLRTLSDSPQPLPVVVPVAAPAVDAPPVTPAVTPAVSAPAAPSPAAETTAPAAP